LFKRIRNILLIILLTLLSLVIVFFISIRYSAVQTYIAQRLAVKLSRSLGTKVSIDRVAVSFFNKADLVNFYMEDRNHDTLIFANELNVQFSVFNLFDKRISVTKMVLDGGKLHLRLDSTGQVLNLTDVFTSRKPVPEGAKPQTGKNDFSWDISLTDLELRKTDFSYNDVKSGTDVGIFLSDCNINVRELNMAKKLLLVHSIRMDGADIDVRISARKGARPPRSENNRFHFLQDGMAIRFDELTILHSHLSVNDMAAPALMQEGIDFKHMDIQGISLLAESGSVIGDTIITNIKSLTAQERSGFNILNLSTQAHVSVNDITLDKLDIKTPESDIKKYLSLRFNNFDNFNSFFDSVTLKANFADTRVSLRDLNYFIHGLGKVEHNRITISGEIDGRISELHGSGIELRTGNNTVFKGDLYTKGLPNIYETSLNLRVDKLATTASDVRRIYPSLRLPANLDNLGLVDYTGSLDGFITDFVSTGKLVTSIGSGSTDVNFKYDRKNNKASYEGNLSLTDFDLGKYSNSEKYIGRISLQAKVNGRGITPESLHVDMDGTVDNITLLGHQYNQIKVNGLVENKSFSGGLKIQDQFLAMDFNGKTNFSDSIPVFDFDANVQTAMLKQLNLSKDDIRLSGQLNSNFRGTKLDELVGSIDLRNVTITRDSLSCNVKHFGLNTSILPDKSKSISIVSDFAEADIEGNFNFHDLPHAVEDFVKRTFTRTIVDTSFKTQQNFTVDLRIYDPGNLSRIIYPDLYLIKDTRITGEFNSNQQMVNMDVNIPDLVFRQFRIHDAEFSATSKNGAFNFETTVDRIYNGDNLMLDSVAIISKTDGKDIRFDVRAADENRNNYVNLTAMLTPLKDKAVIQLMPSDIKLGGYRWNFSPNNSITIEGNKITSTNLAFKTDNQSIYIDSYLKNDSSTSVSVKMDNTNIGDFAGIFSAKSSKDMKGNANGKLVLEDIFYKPEIYGDMVVSDFTLAGQLIGDVSIESRLDETGKKINVSASVKGALNSVDVKGYVSLDPGNPEININMDVPRLNINFLNYQFFDRYVKNCRGYVSAQAKLGGTLSKPVLTGDVILINDTVTVSFLNSTYHLQDQRVTLDDHGFDFGALTLYDARNNVIYGSGRINHQNFRNFELDAKITSQSMQFLNTTAKESPNFYGVAYGSGSVIFKGTFNNPVIEAYAKTLPGTYCKLPINSSYQTGRDGFYKFETADITKKLTTHLYNRRLTGIDFTLNLEATPDARMDIILDPVAGDYVSSYGHGSLKIKIPPSGNTNMSGNYEIDHGNYLFTLQYIGVNKPFEINSGSTINFNGDIDKAVLNIQAIYEVRTSVQNLISDWLNTTATSAAASNTTSPQSAAAMNRIPIQLLLNLTGVLEQPTISFNIKAIDVDPAIKSYVDQKLAYLQTNDAEMNKQVFGLLVMHQFLPASTTTASALSSSNYIGGAAASTVSEFLSSQFSNYLGDLFAYTGNSTLSNLDTRFGVNQYSTNFAPSGPATGGQSAIDTRTEVQLALQQRLLNNRITINAGGNLDFGSSTDPTLAGGTATNKSVIPTGDFQIEYSLTPDGRWRAKAFNRTNYDYYNARNENRTGVGLSYRREFDKPGDLFKKNPKKPKPAKKTANPVQKPPQDTGKPVSGTR